MQLNGQNESYALLPLYAAPPPVPAFLGLGMHALTFAGEVYLEFHAQRGQAAERKS